MTVNSIELINYRNYEKARLTLSPEINVITGDNAQGKTNLMEAIFLLTGGKSFRGKSDSELIMFSTEEARIQGIVRAGDREHSMEIRLRRGQRKTIIHNGVKKTPSELYGTFCAVVFCPDDLRIIKDNPTARRKFLDTAISQLRPGYSALLADFTRVYEHKSKILRDGRDKPSFYLTLDDFSEKMLGISASIIRYRAAFLQRLYARAATVQSEFSSGRETLTLRYKTVSSITNPLGSQREIYGQLLEHQTAHRSAEIESGQCLTGPHRDDVEIEINGRPARSFASQGQTRTAALSMKLAERDIFLEELGEYPVLLLDDVLSELDPRRQDFVLNKITGGQTIITCCAGDRISSRTGGTVFTAENGQITAIG